MRDHPFAKRKSGNRGGRPKVVRHVRELARAHCAEAVTVLAKIMSNAKSPPATRLAAANSILHRGYGRPGSATIEPDRFSLPELGSAGDAVKAMGAITTAAARGDLTLAEAAELACLVEVYVKAIGATAGLNGEGKKVSEVIVTGGLPDNVPLDQPADDGDRRG